MAIKKIFRAINTKGTPWDSPEDIEFLIYEDENGNTSVALDGQTLNAEKISQIGGGGDISELEERVDFLETHTAAYQILDAEELESISSEKRNQYKADKGFITPDNFIPENSIVFSNDDLFNNIKFEKVYDNLYISSNGNFVYRVINTEAEEDFLLVYNTYNNIIFEGGNSPKDFVPGLYKDQAGRIWNGDSLIEIPNVDVFVKNSTITVPEAFYLDGTLLSNIDKIAKSINLIVRGDINSYALTINDLVSIDSGDADELIITYMAVKLINVPTAVMVRLTLPAEMPTDPVPVNITTRPISSGDGTPVVFNFDSLGVGDQYNLSQAYQGDDFSDWMSTFMDELWKTGVSSSNLILQTIYLPPVEEPVSIPILYSLQLNSLEKSSTPEIRFVPISLGGISCIPVLTPKHGEMDDDLILTFKITDDKVGIKNGDLYHKCIVNSLTYSIIDADQVKTITFPSAVTYIHTDSLVTDPILKDLFIGSSEWKSFSNETDPNWYTCIDNNKIYRCVLESTETGQKIKIETSTWIGAISWTSCTINSLVCGQLTDCATNEHRVFYTVNE